MITRLDLQDFRGFEKLSLDGLARVNLIVGGNNTGKTSILEALALLAKPGDAPKIATLFRQTADESTLRSSGVTKHTSWLPRAGRKSGTCLLCCIHGDTTREVQILTDAQWDAHWTDPAVVRDDARLPIVTQPCVGLRLRAGPASALPFGYRSVERLALPELKRRLGVLTLVGGAEKILDSALGLLDPRLRRARIVGEDVVPDGVVLDIGLKELIPVTQAGEGVARFLGLLSGMISPGSELSLVDEIENGIHTRAMPNVWKALASAVSDFGVQLFATTHSLECVLAAHEAFLERERNGGTYELRVIQLALGRNGVIVGRVLDRDDVRVSVENEIDVR